MKDTKDSFKALSKYEGFIFLLLINITIYLIQRDLLWFVEESPDLYGAQQQGGFLDLEFSYVTLSIIWPVILLFVGLSLSVLSQRKLNIGIELIEKDANVGKFFFDPFWVQDVILSNKLYLRLVQMLLYLPFAAILIHLTQAIYLSIYLITEGNRDQSFGFQQMEFSLSDSSIYFIVILQLIMTIIAFVFMLKIPKKVLFNWKELRNKLLNLSLETPV